MTINNTPSDKLTIGNISFSTAPTNKNNYPTLPDPAIFAREISFQQQLADALGCDVSAVTVENVVAVINFAKGVQTREYFSPVDAATTALAPFEKKDG